MFGSTRTCFPPLLGPLGTASARRPAVPDRRRGLAGACNATASPSVLQRINNVIVGLVLSVALNGSPVHATEAPSNQSVLMDDLFSSLSARRAEILSAPSTQANAKEKASSSKAKVEKVKEDEEQPQASAEREESTLSSGPALPGFMQNTMQDAALVAGGLFQSAQSASSAQEQPKDTPTAETGQAVQQQVQEMPLPEASDGANLVLGVGGLAVVLLGAVIFQAVQRNKSDKDFTEQISGLSTERSTLQDRVQDLDAKRASLEKSLADEKAAKGKALQRGTELDAQLEKTTRSLDAVSAEKELTKATLVDTQKDLDKEKKAGAALGEQVVDLSKQLESQTQRADKSEGFCKNLEEDITERSKQLKSEQDATAKLKIKVDELESTLQQMTEEASSHAAAAHQLRESAKEAKAQADAAYAKVSSQLQSSMEQAKGLKATLQDTTRTLESTEKTVKSLEAELEKSQTEGKELRVQLNEKANELKKAHGAIEKHQEANSELRMTNHSLQDRVNKLSATLEDTTLRLSTEVDVATEMKSQLAELKLEYIAAGDKLEAEQMHIRELQVDLRNMESALNAVSHDKKAAQMENAQLASQLEVAQKAVLAAEASQQATESELDSGQRLIAGLQARVEELQMSLQASTATAESTSLELEAERQERASLAAQVETLKAQVVSIEQAERTAHEQAQSAVQELRQEIKAAVKARKRGGKGSAGAAKASKGTSAKIPALASDGERTK